VDKTISSLLTPGGFSDLYVNTQNTINLANSVNLLSSDLLKKKKETQKYKDAQEILHGIQSDQNINSKVGENVKASFYNSFSKKMTDFLNSGS
jgi:hypothetical protein